MKKGSNNMDNTSDEQFIILQAAIEPNKQETKAINQDSDDKMTKITEDSKPMLKSDFISMMGKINMSKPLPDQRDSPKLPDLNTVVLTNKRDPTLNGGHYMKILGMWTLKNNIS